MCTGTVYDLVCGHHLIHISGRCSSKCAVPQGPRLRLQDTCAKCHPSFQVAQINSRFIHLLDQTMRCYRQATDARRFDEADAIERSMRKQKAEWSQCIHEAKQCGRGCPSVVWPGKDEAQGEWHADEHAVPYVDYA